MKHRIKKMISFELGKEIAKNSFRLVTSEGQIKKKNKTALCPHEESAPRCCTIEPKRLYGERGPLRVYETNQDHLC